MNKLLLLTDGSVDTRSHIGYGAYLAVVEPGLLPAEALRARVRVRRFEDTSSTKLELQTLLWALGEIEAAGRKVLVYTDSQNIMGLPGRRGGLEQNDYCSKRNRRLGNHELYREFFRMTDQLDCELVKVRGHRPAGEKDAAERLFAFVDRASRTALRGEAP